MKLSRLVLLWLCAWPLWATTGAFAQADKWDKPVDLKPLVPVFQIAARLKAQSRLGRRHADALHDRPAAKPGLVCDAVGAGVQAVDPALATSVFETHRTDL